MGQWMVAAITNLDLTRRTLEDHNVLRRFLGFLYLSVAHPGRDW